ncbi:MAG: MFS transporter [archaeon]|nr:MFS transporter [archaeon]
MVEEKNERDIDQELMKYNIDQKQAFGTLMLCIFMDVMGYSMIIPLLPEICTNFGAGAFQYGIILASNSVFALFFGPLWGKLSDKYGRKPILFITQIGTAIAFLVLGLSSSLYMILLSRIIDGVFGGQIPVIRAYVSDLTDPRERSSKIGKIAAGMSFGMIFGPALGGFLGTILWQLPAILSCIFSSFLIILTQKKLIESMPKERIIDLKKEKELLKQQNGGKKQSILSKLMLLRLIEVFLLNLIMITINSSLPVVIYQRYNGDPIMIGILMSISGILMIFYSGFLLKRLIKKFGEIKLIIIILPLGVILSISYPYYSEFWMLFISIIPFILVFSVARPIIMSGVFKAAPPDQQGEASGYSTTLQSVAESIAPLIATGFLELVTISIFEFSIDSYMMIGLFCTLITVCLIICVIIDIRNNADSFAKPINK